MREHQPVDLLKDQFRSLASQHDTRSKQIGLDLVMHVFDLPTLVVQAGEFVGWESIGIAKRRRKPDGFAGAFREAVLHHPDPASVAALSVI